MRQSIGVDMTKKWKNSLGIPMIPLREGAMMAAWETRNKDFNVYASINDLENNQVDSSVDISIHPKVNISVNDVNRFCNWLTDYEREKG